MNITLLVKGPRLNRTTVVSTHQGNQPNGPK